MNFVNIEKLFGNFEISLQTQANIERKEGLEPDGAMLYH